MVLPSVSSVNPTSGPTTGGTAVTITGTNFTGATAVTFGGAPATSFTVNTSTQITAITPPKAPGTAVGLSSRQRVPAIQWRFFYAATPTVSSVSPTQVPAAGEHLVTIRGP